MYMHDIIMLYILEDRALLVVIYFVLELNYFLSVLILY